MSPLFRRNNDAPADRPVETAPAVTIPPAKGQSAGKGRPTPKRKDANKRRAPEPPPKDAKEARQRRRAKMAAERAERFEGAKRGEDQYLMARDKGPVRRLVRDIIDSRRNVGPLFFGGVLVVVIFSSGGFPPQVRTAAMALWFLLVALMIADSVIIGIKVKKIVFERFPDTKEKTRSLVFYAVLRSVSFRKLRNPAPQVKPGDKI